jgi:hypothetical protein
METFTEKLNEISDSRLKQIYNYIVDVFVKQERIIPFTDLYGDGTMFLPFSRIGAEMVYNVIIEVYKKHILKD